MSQEATVKLDVYEWYILLTELGFGIKLHTFGEHEPNNCKILYEKIASQLGSMPVKIVGSTDLQARITK